MSIHTPEQFAAIFDQLSTEVTWLHARWKLYRQLFAESPSRIDMLNECAAAIFYVIQDVLLGEVQVMLSKLTDPASSGKYDNLSLERLQIEVELLGQQALATQTRSISINCIRPAQLSGSGVTSALLTLI
jgi:hypothetical protein